MSWEQADDQCWSIDLRCGDCEQSWTEVVPNDRASRYDLELDRDVDAIQRSLDRLERNHMISEIETFVAALDRDLIEPADFAR
jgi:hypothetical protein